MFQRSRRLWQAARNSSSNVNNNSSNSSSSNVKKNYRGSRYRQPNHQKSHQPEFKKGDIVPPPKSLEEARRTLLEWAAEPQRWSNAKKKNAMSLLFQVYDSHPFAVDPTPILERWQKESSGGATNNNQETEAADVYRKFRLHGNPVVASIVLTTRLQFIPTAHEVVEAAQEFLTRHPDNILLYGNVLQRLAVLGNNNGGDKTAGDHMRQFVNTMVQNGVPINVVCFNIMLRYFSSSTHQNNNTEVIFEMVRLMKSCHVLPDHESYTQLVHAYLHAHQPEAAVQALLHIDQTTNLAEASIEVLKYYRNIVTRNTSSFAQKREAVNAAKTVFERVGSRLSPKSKDRLLGVLMDTYVHIGDTQEAKEAFKTIENPEDDKVAILIKAAIKDKDFASAQSYFAKKPTRALLNTFVDACIHTAGGLTPALHMLETVRDGDLPDIHTYNAVLKCANEENPARAVDLLETLPLPPDRVTYNLAMNTCYRLGQYDRALHYLEAMKNDGHEPDSYTYVEMLKLIEDAEAKEAYLVDKIPERNVFHYNIVLQAWAKKKNLSRLIALFDSMKHHGVAADVNTYTCVIVALTKSGQVEHVEKADACLAEMEQLNMRPDIVHYEAVLLAWTDLKDAARATKVLIRRIHAATERPALAPVPANFHNITTLWMHSGNPKQAALIVLRLFDFADQGLLKRGPDERTRFLITSTLVREFKPEYQPIIDQLNLRRRDPPTTKRTAPLPSSPAAASSSASAAAPPPLPSAPLPSLSAPPLPSSPFSSSKLTTLPPRVSNNSNNQDATAAAATTTPHRVSRLP